MTSRNIISQLSRILGSKLFIMTFISILSISLTTVYVMSEPWTQDRFMSISTLGEGMKAEHYFAKQNSTLMTGDEMHWFVNIHNHFGNSKYVSIRMYVLNSTQSIPLDAESEEGKYPMVYESRYLLEDNATVTVPVNWSIVGADKHYGYITISDLKVNGRDIKGVETRSVQDNNSFRVIFELWTYDSNLNRFVLNQPNDSNNENYVWNQIWFKLNI